MFHYSEQWHNSKTREQLLDPNSTHIGKTKIIQRSESLRQKKISGVYKFRMTGTCKGVAEIENYSNNFDDITGISEYHAYHYFDWGEGIWRTEYIVLKLKKRKGEN